MNLHVAFQAAPDHVIEAFAIIVKTGGVATTAARRAGDVVLEWPELTRALEEARTSDHRRRHAVVQRCCGTEDQREYLRSLYHYFNATRFDGRLPGDIPLRFSNRMRSSLGHMMAGRHRNGHRYVVEIALNVDLLLPGNGAERVDTLLHEMAHAADYLFSGAYDHGPSWRAWARSVGCRPTRLYDRPVRRRRSRKTVVTRVPPLPTALRRRSAA